MSQGDSIAIVAIEDVAAALEITDGSADTALETIVQQVSGAVEDYLGRPVLARNVTESVDGNGMTYLLLTPYLISVTTVVIDDVTIAAGDRVFYADTGRVQLKYHTFSTGFQNIDLVYRHGWEVDNIPPAIKRATINWCCQQWLETKHDRVGVASKSTNDGSSITYELPPEIPKSVRIMLEPWRIAGFGC